MKDYFEGAPTVGSHDQTATVVELQARVQQLEQQRAEDEERLKQTEQAPKKSGWKNFFKKAGKVFKKYICPIIDSVTRFMNAFCNCKKAFAR